MDTNERQLAILYEFLMNEGYLSYANICAHFDISEKTVREDIKMINDNFRSLGLKISMVRGKGLNLSYKDIEMADDLKEQFQYRFIDTNDIQRNLLQRIDHVLAYVLSHTGYVKLSDLSRLLNLNTRSTSSILSQTKRVLGSYNLSLVSRPHHGMLLVGREIDIRYCFIDTVCFYSTYNPDIDLFGDNLRLFSMSELEKDAITAICVDYVKHTGLDISQIEIRKLVIMIMVSYNRFTQGKKISFSYGDRVNFAHFDELIDINYLIAKITDYYQSRFPDNEKMLIRLFIIGNLDYSIAGYVQALPAGTYNRALRMTNRVITTLRHYDICGKTNSDNFSEFLLPAIIRVVIRGHFRIIENNANSSLKKAIYNTPLSATIGRIIFKQLQNETSCELGESVYISISLSVYSCIRKTRNIRKMNNIAILTPSDRFTAEPLKRRIMDRYSNIIRQIDIVNTAELTKEHLRKYNHLIYFENIIPLGLDTDIHKLKVDYYFTETDVKNFYEYVAIPSRIYKSSFADNVNFHYRFNYHFSDIAKLKQELQPPVAEPILARQLDELTLSAELIFNNTLNLILFSPRKDNLASYLITLDRNYHFENNRFNRIFIHIIKLNGDMIRLKTAEKVIRNLTCIIDTDDTILSKPYIDFYQYYIYNRRVQLDRENR